MEPNLILRLITFIVYFIPKIYQNKIYFNTNFLTKYDYVFSIWFDIINLINIQWALSRYEYQKVIILSHPSYLAATEVTSGNYSILSTSE